MDMSGKMNMFSLMECSEMASHQSRAIDKSCSIVVIAASAEHVELEPR